jgi:hypothetical protein
VTGFGIDSCSPNSCRSIFCFLLISHFLAYSKRFSRSCVKIFEHCPKSYVLCFIMLLTSPSFHRFVILTQLCVQTSETYVIKWILFEFTTFFKLQIFLDTFLMRKNNKLRCKFQSPTGSTCFVLYHWFIRVMTTLLQLNK